MKAELVFQGTSKYLFRKQEGGEEKESVVLSQPAVYSSHVPDREQGSLTTKVVSIPDLYLTLSANAEVLGPIAPRRDCGCWSSHGHARSSSAGSLILGRPQPYQSKNSRRFRTAATLHHIQEAFAYSIADADNSQIIGDT